MFAGRMTLSQSSLLFGPLEELQELAFIERPIRRSLKVPPTPALLTDTQPTAHVLDTCEAMMVMMMRVMVTRVSQWEEDEQPPCRKQRGDPLCAQHDAVSVCLSVCGETGTQTGCSTARAPVLSAD